MQLTGVPFSVKVVLSVKSTQNSGFSFFKFLMLLDSHAEPPAQRDRGVRVRGVRQGVPGQGDARKAHELPRRGEAARVPRVREEVRQGNINHY